MTKFKNKTLKEVIDSPGVKAVTISVPIAALGINAARLKNERDRKKLEEERIALEKEQEAKIDKLSRKLTRKLNKIDKKFSIVGGGNKKSKPLTIMERAIKYTADNSVYNIGATRKSNYLDLISAFKECGGEENINYTVNKSSSEYSSSICAYYKNQVLVILTCGLIEDDLEKLSKILDDYCRAFNEADYGSEFCNGRYMIELNVIEDTENFLVKRLIDNNIKVNILK